jgi:hypothetical protein
MKKLLMAFGLLTLPGIIYAGGQGTADTLTVSSGTFKKIGGFSNNGGNFIQAMAVADSSYPVTAPVDSIQGLTVNLATSSLTTATAVKVDGSAVTQPISGTVTSNQGAVYAVNGGTITVKIDGSSNTVQITGTPSVSVSNSPTVVISSTGVNGSTITAVINGTPSVSVTNTPSVTISGTPTVAQSAAFLVNGGTITVKVDGSSNTVQVTGNPGVSQSGTWNMTISSGSNTGVVDSTGAVMVGINGDHITLGTSTFQVQYATIAYSSSGYSIVIATVSGRTIGVVSYHLTSNGTVNVKWQSSGGSATDETGLDYLVANTGSVDNCYPGICFHTKSGEGLAINLSAGVAVGGHFRYVVY